MTTTTVTTTANNLAHTIDLDLVPGTTRELYRAVREADREVPLDPAWSNGTGYFDGAVKAPVPVGETWGFFDPRTRRAGVLVGTRFGTVALFERHSQSPWGPSGVIVCNTPRCGGAVWSALGFGSAMSASALHQFLADKGRIVEDMARDYS